MGVGFQFGKGLAARLFDTFSDAQRDIEITQITSFNPITETGTTTVFNGKCIRTGLDGASYESQNILDAEFNIVVKAADVPFEVRQDNCELKVQDIDPSTFADLGFISCEILSVKKDGVDAVYKIMAKRK